MSDNDLIKRKTALSYMRSALLGMTDPTEIRLRAAKVIKDGIPAVPHEMTAREFAKAFKRFCDSQSGSISPCENCELDKKTGCSLYKMEDAIPIVEQWAAEHPEKKRKTYAEDFFEKFPKAGMDEDETPSICRKILYDGYLSSSQCECRLACYDCWNVEMEDKDE